MHQLTVFISFTSVLRAWFSGELTRDDLYGIHVRFWFGCHFIHVFEHYGYPMEITFCHPPEYDKLWDTQQRREWRFNAFPGEIENARYLGELPEGWKEKFEELQDLIRTADAARHVRWKSESSWTQECVEIPGDGVTPPEVLVIDRDWTYPSIRDLFHDRGHRVWYSKWITRIEQFPRKGGS